MLGNYYAQSGVARGHHDAEEVQDYGSMRINHVVQIGQSIFIKFWSILQVPLGSLTLLGQKVSQNDHCPCS